MPVLKREPDLFPPNLFELDPTLFPWRVAHVRSRQEKVLARYLHERDLPFYLPQTENKIVTKLAPAPSPRHPRPGESSRSSTAGVEPSDERQLKTDNRVRKPTPVFAPPASASPTTPYSPVTSFSEFRATRPSPFSFGVIVNLLEVADQPGLAGELGQLRELQASGASLVPHAWLGVGDEVKVTEGSFKGYRGVVVREHGRERLIVTISMIRQSVMVEFDREVLAPAPPVSRK